MVLKQRNPNTQNLWSELVNIIDALYSKLYLSDTEQDHRVEAELHIHDEIPIRELRLPDRVEKKEKPGEGDKLVWRDLTNCFFKISERYEVTCKRPDVAGWVKKNLVLSDKKNYEALLEEIDRSGQITREILLRSGALGLHYLPKTKSIIQYVHDASKPLQRMKFLAQSLENFLGIKAKYRGMIARIARDCISDSDLQWERFYNTLDFLYLNKRSAEGYIKEFISRVKLFEDVKKMLYISTSPEYLMAIGSARIVRNKKGLYLIKYGPKDWTKEGKEKIEQYVRHVESRVSDFTQKSNVGDLSKLGVLQHYVDAIGCLIPKSKEEQIRYGHGFTWTPRTIGALMDMFFASIGCLEIGMSLSLPEIKKQYKKATTKYRK